MTDALKFMQNKKTSINIYAQEKILFQWVKVGIWDGKKLISILKEKIFDNFYIIGDGFYSHNFNIDIMQILHKKKFIEFLPTQMVRKSPEMQYNSQESIITDFKILKQLNNKNIC